MKKASAAVLVLDFLKGLVPVLVARWLGVDALSPAPDLLVSEGAEAGRRPQALATDDRSVVLAYLPVGGEVTLKIGPDRVSRWFDPRTGDLRDADCVVESDGMRFVAPRDGGANRPSDWVLVACDADYSPPSSLTMSTRSEPASLRM